MSNETPPPTDFEIYERGKQIMFVAGPRDHTIDEWVREIASRTGTRTDWERNAGQVVIYVLGDAATRRRVQEACVALKDTLIDAYMAFEVESMRMAKRGDVRFQLLDID